MEELHRIEDGVAPGSTTTWQQLAAALELDPWALLDGVEQPRPGSRIFLRHRAWQDFSPEDEAPLRRALDAGRTLRRLAEASSPGDAGHLRQQFSPMAAPRDIPGPAARPPAATDGYRRASGVRGVLARPPVRLAPDAAVSALCALVEEHFDIAVLVFPLASPGASATSIRDTEGAATIVLNARAAEGLSPLLARVHLAHELCHLLFDPGEAGVQLVLDRDDLGGSAAEQRARAFAAEFLLPLAGLRRVLGAPRAVASREQAQALVDLARHEFFTPWKITAFHLVNRGFVARSLEAWLPDAPPPSAPPSPLEELPASDAPSRGLLARLRQAWERNDLTDGQVKVALEIPVDEPLPAAFR